MFLNINYLLILIIFMFSCSKSPVPDIPVSELEPQWSSWKSYNYEGEAGMYCKKQEDMIVQGFNNGTMRFISFDANGMQVPPTKPGSKFFFETEGCELVWVNGLRIRVEEKLVFNIADEGLFYNSGKGRIVFKDGHSIEY